ncbi:MAG: beta-ketoacyl-ACP synthase II [Anaerolineae bacterium]
MVSSGGKDHRVVITGMGAITPVGLNVADFWQGITAGRSGVGPITQFDASQYPTQIAASVDGFDPTDYVDKREARRMARFTHFALAATQQALQDAELDLAREDLTRVGLEIGSAIGGIDVIEEQSQRLQDGGPRRINPILVPSVIINIASCHIAVLLGIKGPASAPVAACATGGVAIGEATRRLQRGDVDVMIAGGTESAMTPLAVVGFSRLGALSTRNDEPERACRPFDAGRDGTVMGEGAAIVVLESLEHALRRGAPIQAEVVGYGFTEDAYHIVAPQPGGDGAARAMSLALADAGLSPEEIGYIGAHGTGTVLNDTSETAAIKTVFGGAAYRVPISANKSMLGHMFGGAGSISVITAVKVIQEGVIPPTINLDNPDPECDLDYVPNVARQATVDVAIANAFGIGGQNATVAVQRSDGT